jgi:hypothetical protein
VIYNIFGGTNIPTMYDKVILAMPLKIAHYYWLNDLEKDDYGNFKILVAR